MNDLLSRLTSRKFALALASGIFGALAAAGVISSNSVAADTALAAPALFILMEGLADLAERKAISAKTIADAKAAAIAAAPALVEAALAPDAHAAAVAKS